MASPERTLLVTSTGRTLTTAEKMPLGDGRFDATACSTSRAGTAATSSRSTWTPRRATRAPS